ncbi:MAG: RHS repeat-associated core domain-containing protein [Saprospiraceae bacterium]
MRCGVNLKLTAGNEIKIIDSLHIPSCGALVQTYSGPCTDAKYTEGFNQQSVNRLYEYDAGGNMTYDPNKKLTFYYNYHNLPYRIVGAENDQLQLLYGADGTLLQRKYLKNNIVITKTDYLRGVEYKSDTLESVHHPDGRAIKSGSDWIYEYWIKDHLGNVRVTYRDNNGDNIIDFSDQGSTSVHNYYTFGMEWINLADTLQPRNLYRYNGKEMIEEMDLNLAGYGARYYNPTLGIFHGVDAWVEKYPSWSPYVYTLNNPIRYTDPTGNGPTDHFEQQKDGSFVKVSNTGGDKFHTIVYNDGKVLYLDGYQNRAYWSPTGRGKESSLPNVGNVLDVASKINDAGEVISGTKTDIEFKGKSGMNKVAGKIAPVLDILSIANDYNNTDFSNKSEKSEFTKDAVQTGISQIPLIGTFLDWIMDSSRDESSIFNLENGKMSRGYSTSKDATSNMVNARIEQRKREMEEREKNKKDE